ncbi:uncharacterized protein [Argopecten irradians]|uniref:uncharacterized protein n=1 Tax=Argopecten irradians TaxID=31199 RepID=UPI0037116850
MATCKQVAVRAKGNPKCTFHKNKDVLLHCEDCNILICLTCSLSTHQGHGLVELADIMPQRKCVLQDFINDTESKDLVQLQNEIDSIEEKLAENEAKVKDCGLRVKQEAEIWKQQIDVLSEEYISNFHKMAEENRDLLLQYKDELQQRYNALVDQVKECKQILQSGNSVEVYDETSNISTGDVTLPDEPVLREVDFQPSEFEDITEELRKVFGKFTSSSLSTVEGNVTSSEDISKPFPVEEVSSSAGMHAKKPVIQFRTSMKCSSICPTTSGVWLRQHEAKEMQLVDFKGKVKQKIKYDLTIRRISVSPKTNNAWFATYKTVNEVIAGSKSPTRRFSVNDTVSSFCVTNEDTVAVCDLNAIKIYTREGQEVHSNNLEGRMFPLMYMSQCPVKCNFAIGVSRSTLKDGDERRKAIVVFSKTLDFLFEYTGEKSGGKSSFNPRFATYDNRGNLVIVDTSGSIQLVSGSGQPIRTLQKISRITAVGLEFGGDVLWICRLVDKGGLFGKLTSAEESEIRAIKYYD